MKTSPTHSTGLHGERGSVRELLNVALPLIISSGSVSLMHVVDRIYLTWWSPDAFAAALPSGLCFWLAISLPLGIAVYTNTFVAQYDGAGRKERLVASVWQGAYLSILAGLLLLGLLPLASPLFAWMGHKPAVQAYEVDYFSIMLYGAAPMVLAAVLSSFFSGRGHTRIVMGVNLLVALINVALDYVLIFGVEGVILPGGMRGAAVATVIAQAVGAALFAWLVVKACRRDEYPLWEQRRFDWNLSARILWYGLPNGVQFVVDISGFTVFIALVGGLGDLELRATNLAFNLNSLAFIPMMGLGTAVMTLVGQRVGEREPELAVRTTWLACLLSMIYMFVWAVLFLAVPDAVIAPYAAYAETVSFDEIRPTVVVLLRFVVFYTFFDALVIVFGAAVRGAGDTKFSMWFSFASAWLVMVLPVYLASRAERLSLRFAWWAVTLYIIFLGAGFLARFLQGRWKSMSVIEPDLIPDEPEEPAAPASSEPSAPALVAAAETR